MFDFDAGKFLIIGVVALIVIGPKELPRVLRQVGQMVGRVRRMATEFQGQFMDAMKEADIESIRQDLKKIGDEAEITTHFDPARDIQRELTASLEEPAVMAALPAMAELGTSATSGFALPAPADEMGAGDTMDATLADAGAVPIALLDVTAAEPLAIEHAADAAPGMNGASVFAPSRKRKIRVPKRQAVSRTHAVSDRTALGRARPAILRGQEVADR